MGFKGYGPSSCFGWQLISYRDICDVRVSAHLINFDLSEMMRLPPVCFCITEQTDGSGGESGMSAMELNEVNSGHNGSPRGKTNPFPGRMSSLFQRMSSENAM